MLKNMFRLLLLALFAVQPFYIPSYAQTSAPAAEQKAARTPTLASLRAAVYTATQNGGVPIIIFDLDDTTFDSRYKRLMIINDFVRQPAIASAYPAETAKILPALGNPATIKASMRETMSVLGITDASFITAVSEFNRPRIMSNDYLARELPVAGAIAYINSIYAAGGRIMYVSARGPELRPGTEAALRANKLPYGVPGTMLYLNERNEDAVVYKSRVLGEIKQTGTVMGGFENEPDNINLFKTMFPNGSMFFLNTRKSSNTPLKPGIVVIDNYLK